MKFSVTRMAILSITLATLFSLAKEQSNAQWVQTGQTSGQVTAFAVNGSNLFAGPYPGGVSLSTDDGVSWTVVDSGLEAFGYTSALVLSGQNLFAALYISGVFLSTNNGTSWTGLSKNFTPGYVRSLAVKGSYLFAGTNFDGVIRSSDSGATWTRANNGLADTIDVSAFAVDGPYLYAGTGGGGVYLSTDDGMSWTAANAGIRNMGLHSLAVNGSILFAGTGDGGVFRSTNYGATWTAVNNGLTDTYVNCLAVVGTTLFAGTTSGVFLSTDDGTTWVDFSSGLPTTIVYAISASRWHLFAGTSAGVWRYTLPGAPSLTESVREGWNMLSVPLLAADYGRFSLLPTSSSVFAYHGSYEYCDTLRGGEGYWAKFPSLQQLEFFGTVVYRETVNVSPNWNMIGSIGSPIAVSDIGSDPVGIVTSNFFGYDSSYHITDSIRPGKAYWVRVNQPGKLILSRSPASSPAARIRIVPTDEMPPAPPGRGIPDDQKQLPKAFALEQNYPNPFNPSTVIRYQLPVNSHVTLKLYDVLGREVKTLIDASEDAGFNSVELDARNLASGIYYYRIVAGSFSDTRKLLLAK